MKPRRFCRIALLPALTLASLRAVDPGPSQSPYAVNPPFVGAGLNAPFPDNYYGADHGGSSISLGYPFTSPFGNTDHSRGVITYYCAPFTPRGSEGVYGMDVWLEASPDGVHWSVASENGGLADGAGSPYQPINTPNPGPSPTYLFQWTFDSTPLPPQTTFRILVYVYLYNQGGGSQGNFYVASSLGTVASGAADDPPNLAWDPSYGSTNPTSVTAGDTYLISATGTDDNGNLSAVQIYRNGQPFASSGGGNGWTATAAGSGADSSGLVTYTAQATDLDGLTSPLISWTVAINALQTQPAVSSSDASLNLGQAFTPEDSGGAGTGGWQFCIGGYTNFNGGATDDTGTNLPAGGWVPAWTAPAAGSYAFWVSRNGDSSYAPSAIAGPYTLTVTDPNAGNASTPSAPTSPSSPAAGTTTSTASSSPSTSSTSSDSSSSSDSSTTTATSSSSSTSSSTTSTTTASGPTTPSTPSTPPAPVDSGGTTPAAPSTPTSAPAPVEIARIRFNATGHDASVQTTPTGGLSILWTDPAGLLTSPWPNFNWTSSAAVSTGSFPLPSSASP